MPLAKAKGRRRSKPISANMQKQIRDLREQRMKAWTKAKEINDKAESEKRKMTREEEGSWEQTMKEVDELKERISALERMADAEDDDEPRDDEEEEEGRDDNDDEEEEEDDEDDDDERSNRPRYVRVNGKRMLVLPTDRKQFRSRKRPGKGDARGGDGGSLRLVQYPGESQHDFATRCRRSTREYTAVFLDYMCRGDAALSTRLARRAVQADSDIVGGYLIAPQEFTSELIKFVNNYVFIRSKGTVKTLKAAQSLGAPSLDTDPSQADWTSELDTGNEDNAMSFGKRELTPRPLSKRLLIGNKVLRMASITGGFSADNSVRGGDAESLIRDRLAYIFAITEEQAFLTGSGTNEPLGIFTASTRGVSTARDIVTGNPNGVSVDALIAMQYSLKVQYWPQVEWIFHRNILEYIRKLKDAHGNYLWVPGGMGGEADTMLGRKVNLSEYAPNVLSNGLYIGALYWPKAYWIADSEQLEIQRLNELYAAANMTGFIARHEIDGMPVLEEAFARLKCSA